MNKYIEREEEGGRKGKGERERETKMLRVIERRKH